MFLPESDAVISGDSEIRISLAVTCCTMSKKLHAVSDCTSRYHS